MEFASRIECFVHDKHVRKYLMLSQPVVMGLLAWYNTKVTSLTVVAVFLALLSAVAVRQFTDPWSKRDLMYLEFPGTLFVRGLICIVLPTIISSIIVSVGTLDPRMTGKIGRRAFTYYFTTTITAVVVALLCVILIHPGSPVGRDKSTTSGPRQREVTSVDSVLDLMRNLVPNNIIQATMMADQTSLHPPADEANETDIKLWDIKVTAVPGTNLVGLVMFSIFFGLALSKMGDKGLPLLQVFDALATATITMTTWMIKATPFAIFCLVMPRIIEAPSVADVVKDTGLYILTCLVAAGIHSFMLVPLYYYLVSRNNPYRFLQKLGTVILTGIGTASSSASMPVTMRSLVEDVGLDSRVVRFLIPLGATVNMDGSAIYFLIATLYVAQSNAIYFGFGKLLVTALIVTTASVGAAGVPNGGIVMMLITLAAVDLPVEDISLIILADWFLDRLFTVINLIGDSFGCGVLDHLSRDDLELLDMAANSKASPAVASSNNGSVETFEVQL
ncbi:Excitatory amino acid transporter [Halotydeus destructor]|nr:Excitatory amino acid transporter [Halotydeus destructor]